jgi:hypothetical protein
VNILDEYQLYGKLATRILKETKACIILYLF